MGIVIADLLLLLTVVAFCGFAAFAISKRRDVQLAHKNRLRQEEEKQRCEQEARVFQAGVPLVCLNCDVKFLGPMPASGCPHCNVGSLVVTQEYFEKNGRTKNKLG